jgi:hypothetical protein
VNHPNQLAKWKRPIAWAVIGLAFPFVGAVIFWRGVKRGIRVAERRRLLGIKP